MLTAFISKIISYLKNENFVIDNKVSFSYLLIHIVFRRICMLTRGIVTFAYRGRRVFIERHVQIRARSKISIKGNLLIDDYVYIDALSEKGIIFGKNVSIGKYTSIECSGTLKNIGIGLVIGDSVGIGSYSLLGCAGGISIGENTIVGNFVSFHSENHNYTDKNLPIRMQGVNRQGIFVGKNCWIGAKATILDGVKIGDRTIIAAGAVVPAGNYPDNIVLGGVPARILKTI